MRDFTIPERGVLGILIEDIPLKSPLLLFTLISDSKKLKTRILLQRLICSYTVKTKRVSDGYCFITIFVRLNNEQYIYRYYILDYNDNIILDLNVSDVSFLVNFPQFLKQPYLFIYLTIFEVVKELYKVHL